MKEAAVLEEFICSKKMRHSKPRDWILSVFVSIEKHLTVDELWAAVRKKHPTVGYATVYRTLKLFCESGLCSELNFEDGTTRYEHRYGHHHHDHLICTACGAVTEVFNGEIEKLQEKLIKEHGFSPCYHRMNLYGVCKDCRKKGM
jgi:Fur family transcriptional regulator, ferric uptake regulator